MTKLSLIREIGKKYKANRTTVYQTLWKLEDKGIIKAEREGKNIILSPEAIEKLEKELESLGYNKECDSI